MEAIEQPLDLERIFRESADDLARYFARRHSDQEQAQDLVQETFAEMARGIQKGLTPKSPRAYLFGIARRISMAAWKRRDREKVVTHEFPVEAAADTQAGPDDRLISAHEVIAALPPLQREILDLRFTQDLSYAEIAEALDIPIGTVRSRIHNAVAAIRQRLADDTQDEISPS